MKVLVYSFNTEEGVLCLVMTDDGRPAYINRDGKHVCFLSEAWAPNFSPSVVQQIMAAYTMLSAFLFGGSHVA